MHILEMNCPHCGAALRTPRPRDYAPREGNCAACGEHFYFERTADSCAVYRPQDAPCCSDPNCRETELSLGDED